VDLGQIMREVVIDLESTILENKGTITLDETFPKIEADPFQMRQLFQNILSNALKFHKKEKPPIITVTVKEVIDQSSEEESKKWLISIADNGIGFDEKYLDRIFTIFERLHGRNDFSGTGIGLAVCRKIVERHYGILTAKSNPDVGTTFLLTLPETQPKEKGGEQI
jgi:light-regulated signal transduction histidine kinase (bacteriophytochrome)